jgi:hypothetical protein
MFAYDTGQGTSPALWYCLKTLDDRLSLEAGTEVKITALELVIVEEVSLGACIVGSSLKKF